MAATASSSGGHERPGTGRRAVRAVIVTCQKWVALGVADADSADHNAADQRFGGTSAADQAALEWALRLGAARSETVTVIAVGPDEASKALREAAAAGADRLLRVDSSTSIDSVDVAAAIASALQSPGAADVSFIVCGDYSLDRGSGSVPAFLAAMLGLAMALGAVGIDLADGTDVEVLRRLDGGRRERLRLHDSGVISVEGSTARLRRAPLSGVLASKAKQIEVHTPTRSIDHVARATTMSPYRPRARQLAPPVGDNPLARLHALTSAEERSTHGETVVLDPQMAARRIVEALTVWGYLNGESGPAADASTR